MRKNSLLKAYQFFNLIKSLNFIISQSAGITHNSVRLYDVGMCVLAMVIVEWETMLKLLLIQEILCSLDICFERSSFLLILCHLRSDICICFVSTDCSLIREYIKLIHREKLI